jgi:hypothetical protein
MKVLLVLFCPILAERQPLPLLRVSDEHYAARPDPPVLYSHRQFNEWKHIHVFDTKLFLSVRGWSHVLSSRPHVSHRTEQPIHSGVASNHGSCRLCFQQLSVPLSASVCCLQTSTLYASAGSLCVLRISPSLLPLFFDTRVSTAAHSFTSSNFISVEIVQLLVTVLQCS